MQKRAFLAIFSQNLEIKRVSIRGGGRNCVEFMVIFSRYDNQVIRDQGSEIGELKFGIWGRGEKT